MVVDCIGFLAVVGRGGSLGDGSDFSAWKSRTRGSFVVARLEERAHASM